MIISFLNQKGGVGKSTLARATAIEFVKNGWEVHVADMDKAQRTTTHWAETRVEAGITPQFTVASYLDATTALKTAGMYDLLVVDGAAYADTHTLEVGRQSDLVVIPTGVTADDLRASLNLGQELTLQGTPRTKIIFVAVKVPNNGDKEAMITKKNIGEWGFAVAQGWIPFKTAYGQAMDKGRTMTETRHGSLNKKADRVLQTIVDKATALAAQTEIAS